MSNAGCASTRRETRRTRPIRCGISTTCAGNYAGFSGRRVDNSQPKTTIARATPPHSVALLLLLKGSAITMLRLSVLAIVLAVGIGPYASNLCRAWCAGDTLPQACHSQMGSPAAVADDCCDSRAIDLSAVRSAESRRDTISPSQYAVAAQHHVALSAASARFSHRHEPRGSNESSLVTVLRI